jgi:hypothetical protein
MAVTPFYSQNNVSGTNVGTIIDCTAFTQDSSCLIKISSGADMEVHLQGNLDPDNSATWVVCGIYTDSAWVRIPFACAYFRTVTQVWNSGTVTSIFGRGIADNSMSVVSAQAPSTFTTGAQ